MCGNLIQVSRPSNPPISFIQIELKIWLGLCDEAIFLWSKRKWTINWKTTMKIDKIFLPSYVYMMRISHKRKIRMRHKKEKKALRLYQQFWSSFFIIISAWWKSIKKIDLTNGKLPRSSKLKMKWKKFPV
jgi:hypothetical protein